jgi:hypothetical protein
VTPNACAASALRPLAFLVRHRRQAVAAVASSVSVRSSDMRSSSRHEGTHFHAAWAEARNWISQHHHYSREGCSRRHSAAVKRRNPPHLLRLNRLTLIFRERTSGAIVQ